MRNADYFEACRVCGRTMRIKPELFGQRIRCGHCHAETQAIATAKPGPLADFIHRRALPARLELQEAFNSAATRTGWLQSAGKAN